MTTGTWGKNASKGIRAVIAAFFAMALVLALSTPAALAQENGEEAGDGVYVGFLVDADFEDQWIDAAVIPAGESLEDVFEDFEGWFEEEEPPSEEEFAEAFTFRFLLTENDDYWVNGEETDKFEFLCAAIITIEEEAGHFFGAGYQQDDDSMFGLFTEAEEDNGWCPEEPEPEPEEHAEPEPDDDDDAEPVERAERVETGAGGTAGGGAGVLALLFGLIAVAGATVLRKGSATS